MSLSSFVNRCARDPSHFFKRMRWESWKLLEERTVQINSLHGEIRFSSKDQIIGRALYLTGNFAISDIHRGYDLLVKEGLLKPSGNAILLDIGANIGTTCIPLMREGKFLRAIAFEPEAKNLGFLLENLQVNNLSKDVHVCSCALSDDEGVGHLYLSGSNFGDHRVSSDKCEQLADRQSVKVKLRTLDNELQKRRIQMQDVSLIWMDTQGYEFKILKGAPSLIKSPVPMVMEFWPEGIERAGDSFEEFSQMLGKAYKHFYDLKDARPQRRNTSEISGLARELHQGSGYTDLVLIP